MKSTAILLVALLVLASSALANTTLFMFKVNPATLGLPGMESSSTGMTEIWLSTDDPAVRSVIVTVQTKDGGVLTHTSEIYDGKGIAVFYTLDVIGTPAIQEIR